MQEKMKQDTIGAEAADQERPEAVGVEIIGGDQHAAAEAGGRDQPETKGNGSVPLDEAETAKSLAEDAKGHGQDDGAASALGELAENMDKAFEAVKDGSNPGVTSMFEGIKERWNRLAAKLGMESAEDLKAQADEYKDQWLRALAEAQNVRKRAERDKSEMSRYGASRLARDVLPVRDGLKRALDHVGEEERTNAKALVDGIELTLREFTNSLSRNGIEQIAPEKSDAFDPNYHEAMINAPSEEVEKGKIIQVFEEGFILHDRLLRPAKVMVSTGAPTPVVVEGGAKPKPKPEPKLEPEPEPTPKRADSVDGPGSDIEIDIPDMEGGGE